MKMTIIQAEKEGVQAYNDGRQMAPALNAKFIVEACKSDVSTAKLLKAYIHGWTIASLADNALTSQTPSIGELERICLA
jgi:hypothetical protein